MATTAGTKKAASKEVPEIKRRIGLVELEISQLETRKKELELILADPELYKRTGEVKTLSAEYKEIPIRLEDAYARWSQLSDRLDKEQSAE